MIIYKKISTHLAATYTIDSSEYGFKVYTVFDSYYYQEDTTMSD